MTKTTKRPARRTLGSLCRCTPNRGIVALNPDYSREVYDSALRRLLRSDNPGFIAAHAIEIGETLNRSGRPLLALKLMKTSLRHLMGVDAEKQENYARQHYCPLNPDYYQWYHPWSARVSEVDARRLAARIDSLQDDIFRHLGHHERSHLRFRIHPSYETLFNYIYEV
jgi:hypothetical protein